MAATSIDDAKQKAKIALEVYKKLRKGWALVDEFINGPFDKRAGNISAISMLLVALVLDLFSIIPIVGDITNIIALCIFFPWFLLLRYRFQRNITQKFAVNILTPIIEAIPALSILPAILVAVGYNLFQMRLEDWIKWQEKKLKNEEDEKKRKEELQKKQQILVLQLQSAQRNQQLQLEVEQGLEEQEALELGTQSAGGDNTSPNNAMQLPGGRYVMNEMVRNITKPAPAPDSSQEQSTAQNRGINDGNRQQRAA